MAIVQYTQPERTDDYIKVVWANVSGGDTCAPWAEGPEFDDRTMQVEGDFGTCTAGVQGSCSGNGYSALSDEAGNAASGWTSARVRGIITYTPLIKPEVTGSDVATALTFTLIAKRKRK